MSIRLKLTLYWSLALGMVLLASALAVYIIFARALWSRLDTALLEEAETSAAAMTHAGGPRAIALARALSRERDLGPRRRVRIVSNNVVLADFGDTGADLPAPAPGKSIAPLADGRKHRFTYASAAFALDGRPALLEDGVDSSVVRDSIRRLRNTLLFLFPLMVAMGAVSGYWLAGRALQPLVWLRRALGEIGPRDLERRIKPPEVTGEVAQVAAEINALLARVERAAHSERRFVSDAAHELRTPLAVLRTELEVALSRARDAADYRRALEVAQRETVTLCATAEELLSMARLESETRTGLAAVKMREVVDATVAVVRPLAEAKAIELTAAVDSDAAVTANPAHLRRILLNLLDNAIKFTPASGKVEVGCHDRGKQVAITVADTGPGVAESEIAMVFERFFRAAGGTQQGSGLGLSLCREIAVRYGGQIGGVNRPQGGFEVTVSLPISSKPHPGAA